MKQRYYTFNKFLKERFGERVQKVTLDAGFTCPNRDGTKGTGGCIYCDAYGSGTGARHKYPDLITQAKAGMEFLGKRYNAKKFIMYFQAFSNTYGNPEYLKELYDQVTNIPSVVGLSISTRPDCLSEEILELISSYTKKLMVWIELGLQSIHDETLRFINRGHDYKEFKRGYLLARKYPLLICLHLIIGLPGEDSFSVMETAKEIGRLHPDAIKIHSLYINKGTRLEELYLSGKYRPLEREEYVSMTCNFLEVIPPDIVIQRLTGDPRPSELVAPLWTLDKHKTISLIQKELEKRDSWQGKKYEK